MTNPRTDAAAAQAPTPDGPNEPHDDDDRDDTGSGMCMHGIGFDERCSLCEDDDDET